MTDNQKYDNILKCVICGEITNVYCTDDEADRLVREHLAQKHDKHLVYGGPNAHLSPHLKGNKS